MHQSKSKNFFSTATLFAVMMIVSAMAIQVSAIPTNNFFGAIQTSTASGTTVNQNLYDFRTDVYLNGGPQNTSAVGLPNGTYYFQVTDPSGATLLSSDAAVCRQLTVSGGKISGVSPASVSCPHLIGTDNSANGSTPVQLYPFNVTPNNGGEYKVWLIRQTSNTSVDATDVTVIHFNNRDAKTDNFKVKPENVCTVNCEPPPTTVTLSGHKFYDANADTLDNDGKIVEGVKIHVVFTTGGVITTTGDVTTTTTLFDIPTGSNGNWELTGVTTGSTYVVSEILPKACDTPGCDAQHYWVQTAPVADSSDFQGYSGTANANVSGLDFGNICFEPAIGGKTLGYCSNKNGENTMKGLGANGTIDPTVYPALNPTTLDSNGMASDLAFLGRLNLKNSSLDKKTGNTTDFDPSVYAAFNTWFLNGNAVNMAYMLSVQLSATSLDVRHKFFTYGDAQIADARSLGLGFATIGSVRVSGNTELNAPGGAATYTGNPVRDDEEILKNFLDGVNNNRLPFASPTACQVIYATPAS
jgi:hypothetical protein